MKIILNIYSKGIAQTIDYEKNYVFFVNTPDERQRKIVCILGCEVGSLPSTYLGLPVGLKPPDSFWNDILDRFNKKLAGWKRATLS